MLAIDRLFDLIGRCALVTGASSGSMIDNFPQRRIGEIDELTGPFALASAAGSYVTGTTLVVDGGYAWEFGRTSCDGRNANVSSQAA